MIMKKFLVTLNRPVTIDGGKPELYTIYGLLVPYGVTTEAEINAYVSYLAAMHEWSVKREKSFSVNEEYKWVDHIGVVHPCCDGWALKIQRRCRKRLALDFTLSVIDIDEAGVDCIECGREGSFIVCKSLMENLVRLAQKQAENQECGVVLFNRPLWLPKSFIWDGEPGYCHIYGVITDREIDEKQMRDLRSYLGYLAMVEEVVLNGETPSGYTTEEDKDGYYWYLHGEEYFCKSAEVEAEGNLCRRKLNLRLYPVMGRIPQEYLNGGERDGFIISQELYEDLLGLILMEWMSE